MMTGFAIGLFVGVILGVGTMCVMAMAGGSDDESDQP